MPLTILAQLQARDGKVEALEAALRSLVSITCAEAGCEAYELHRSLETPGFFHLHEIWTSKAEWEAHMNAPHLQAFQARADDLVSSFTLRQLERVA